MGNDNSCKTAGAAIVILLLLIGGVVIAYFATGRFGMDDDDTPPDIYVTPNECTAMNGTTYQDACFTHTDVLLSWPDAQAFCSARGGSLASIPDTSTNGVIADWAFFWTLETQAWFGLNDRTTPDAYVFVRDGAALGAFNRWVPANMSGSPTDTDAGIQACGSMIRNPLGLWRMSICDELHVFVCQYRLASLPAAPGAPSAAPGVASATVAFNAPATDGGDAITLYTVESSPDAVRANSTGSPIVVTGLRVGVSYTFRVSATNGVGEGPASPASNAVVPTATNPGAPTAIVAYPGDRSAAIAFTPPAFDGYAALSGYRLRTYEAGVLQTDVAFAPTGPSSPLAVINLTNGVSYRFRVVAENSVGLSVDSVDSNECIPALGAPSVVTAVVATAVNRGASVAFAVPFSSGGQPIDRYTVVVHSTAVPADEGRSVNGTVSPIVVTGLTVDTPYTFTVVATSSLGTSPTSRVSNAVTPFAVPPTAPQALSATAGGARAHVAFNPPSDNGGKPLTWIVVNATDSSDAVSSFRFAWSVFEGQPTPLDADVKPLTPGESYTFVVVAQNGAGVSPASAAVGPVAVIVTEPDAPFGVRAVFGFRHANVTWTAPHDGGASIANYSIYANATLVAEGVPAAAPLSATVTNLNGGIPYFFTVVAINAHGASLASQPSLVGVPTADPPAKPTNLLVIEVPGGYELSFDPPFDGGSPIIDYQVTPVPTNVAQCRTNPAGWNVGLSSPLFINKNHLCPNDFYTFRVQARNAIGYGPLSDESQQIQTQASTPTEPLNVAAWTNGGSAVKVFWDEPITDGGEPIRNYTAVSNPGGIKVTGLTSPLLVVGLAAGTYRFAMIATNDLGDSPPSLNSNAVTLADGSSAALLPLWIVLGIVGFIVIVVSLFFCRRCLVSAKNRRHLQKDNTADDSEMVIVKDKGEGATNKGKSLDDDDDTTTTGGDIEKPAMTSTSSATSSPAPAKHTTADINPANSLEDEDESRWVSHNN